jgi:hypothetical protein
VTIEPFAKSQKFSTGNLKIRALQLKPASQQLPNLRSVHFIEFWAELTHQETTKASWKAV